nr:SIS domain-containing protein [Oceanococcus sp. HetDA_MAG_MS8]
MNTDFEAIFAAHATLLQDTHTRCLADITQAAELLVDTLATGHRILLCGNGGSAADCQHIAAEIVGRFECERAGLPAYALTTDGSILTSVGNDFGFVSIFERQVRAQGGAGDLLWAYSTSGRSANVLKAVEAARSQGMHTLALTGAGPNELSQLAEMSICVPSQVTARIQEMHGLIGHMLCSAIDAAAIMP